jgi:hypothetical protein
MGKSGLVGPYPLDFDTINDAIARPLPGAFALGYVDPAGKFCVSHVGRSDTDLREKLRNYIGSGSMFKYRTFDNTRGAFEKECQLFHEFRPRGLHPARPAGTKWECPYCQALS